MKIEMNQEAVRLLPKNPPAGEEEAAEKARQDKRSIVILRGRQVGKTAAWTSLMERMMNRPCPSRGFL